MITDPRPLIVALRQQLAMLESNLRRQSLEPHVNRSLLQRWATARAAAQTLATYEVWRDEQVTQEAVGWLLATVLIRFCEDNGLIPGPFLAGPRERISLAEARQARYRRTHPVDTGRLWILDGLDELNAGGIVAPLLDPNRESMGWLKPSEESAQDLISFWRIRNKGQVLFDFTDPMMDTSFLGDLYQNLSEQQRSKYALLETPGFIADFILDYSLEPAIAEFGLDELRAIDPVCGSGTFLLAAFERLMRHQGIEEGTDASPDVVRQCLHSVHGADKNPLAVAITRFRLLVAAMQAVGARTMKDAPVPDLLVAKADSLLSGRDAPGYADHPHFDDEEPAQFTGTDFLGNHSYHAVFGNPPYITPKDKAEAAAYKAAYPDCVGQYSLTIPFIERFFGLGGDGYVGLLVANSFMKREFGRRLVERFLPDIELTHVIDTSGVFIPGLGTPTTILLGRARQPRRPAVEVVTDLRGEPAVPDDPAHGKVWRAILAGVHRAPYQDEWIQVRDVDRETLSSFPWSFGDEATSEVLRKMERGTRLGDRTFRIGYYASTGSDEVFTAPPAYFRRIQAERERIVPVITGSEVRDWQVLPHDEGALFSEADKKTGSSDSFSVHMRRLWPYRTVLEQRRNYSGRSYLEDGRLWYSWHHITETPETHPWPIVFSWVSTHNHFAVLHGKMSPLNSAPVIRLPSTASDSDVTQLTALLNSSLACFWLKQYSNSKGQPRADQTGTGEPWTLFYEFTGTRLADFPLPPDRWSGDRWSTHAKQLDRLAQELVALAPKNLLGPNSAATTAVLDEAGSHWEKAHAKIVSLQEELDWEIYERYGLVGKSNDLSAPDDSIPGLAPGERSFEIVLARRVTRGEINTTWFERNSIQPVTEIPAHWPALYKKVVSNRIELIEHSPEIGLIERPEFKRRWASDSWETREMDAIRSWLLDRCEDRSLWFDGDSPRPMTVNRLADRLRADADADVVGVARLLKGADADLADVLKEIIDGEHVPFLAQYRYKPSGMDKRRQWERTWDKQREEDATGKRLDILVPPKYTSADFRKNSYWRHRGKLDVPKERFISYPDASPDSDSKSLLIGWAGWNHREQAAALIGLIDEREGGDGWETGRLMGLLTGLLEVMPWVRQWHGAVIPEYGQSWAEAYDAFLTSERENRNLTEDALRTWHPSEPKRGRPQKRP